MTVYSNRTKPNTAYSNRNKPVLADYPFDSAYLFDDPATNFDGLPGNIVWTTRIKPA